MRPLPRADIGSQPVANPLDSEYRAFYQRNISVIRNTLTSQINGRTPFDLFGFNICPENDSGPKIRIDLNGFGGGTGAMASSIGPRSRESLPNIDMTTVNQAWPGGIKPTDPENLPQRVRSFNGPQSVSFVSLHETLHLLGLHHETQFWDRDVSVADPDAERVIQYGGSADLNSVMNGHQSFNQNGIAQLSSTDVSCLTHIANRSIMQFPQRRADRAVPPAQQSGTQATPAVETYPANPKLVH